MDNASRFWAKVAGVEDPNDCWIWTAYKSSNGYGRFSITLSPGNYRLVTAHRFAFEQQIGPIAEGLSLDHLCRTRACVNPSHLEPVTHTENIRRGARCTTSDTCKNGHAMTAENTYTPPGRVTRVCRTCEKSRKRAEYVRRISPHEGQ